MKTNNGIVFISPPSDCFMEDDYFEYATSKHFWVKWRFEIMRKLLPIDHRWGMTLDIGCGNGVVMEQIKNNYRCSIAGCDLNLTALRQASSAGTPLYFYNINQQNMDFKEKFSTILLLDVIEHIKDPVGFLESAAFHLKDNGLLLINVPALQFLFSKYDEVQGHTKRYSPDQLKRELESSGFILTGISYWGLTMIPVLMVRKLMSYFHPKDQAMKVGFQCGSRLTELILRSLMKIECSLFPNPPLGSSLLAVAKKRPSNRPVRINIRTDQ